MYCSYCRSSCAFCRSSRLSAASRPLTANLSGAPCPPDNIRRPRIFKFVNSEVYKDEHVCMCGELFTCVTCWLCIASYDYFTAMTFPPSQSTPLSSSLFRARGTELAVGNQLHGIGMSSHMAPSQRTDEHCID